MEIKEFSEAEQKILTASLQVVNECTVGGTRMHAIAEKAGMVQSNVHYYYKTKQDLLNRLQEWILQEFYDIRQQDREKSADTLEEQIHIFFQQKRYMIEQKREYDFAEMDFIVQSKINPKIQKHIRESYGDWRKEMREILVRFRPDLSEEEKKVLPYLIVSLLEGASIQSLVNGSDFDTGTYFRNAEKMALDYLKTGQNAS